MHFYGGVRDGLFRGFLWWNAWQCVWWRHQMETFSALLSLCAGNSPVTGEFPSQSPVTGSFDVFLYLSLNKQLSKQSWVWWFETPSRSLWRHCDGKWQIHPASLSMGLDSYNHKTCYCNVSRRLEPASLDARVSLWFWNLAGYLTMLPAHRLVQSIHTFLNL